MTNKTNKDMSTYKRLLNITQFTAIFEFLKKKDPTFSVKVVNAFYDDICDIYNLRVEFEYPTELKEDIEDLL